MVSKTRGEAGREGRGQLRKGLRDRESLGVGGILSQAVAQSPLHLSKGQKDHTREDAMGLSWDTVSLTVLYCSVISEEHQK